MKRQDKQHYFDQPGFDKFCKNLENAEQRFNEAVAALRAEGLDVSVKELSTYPTRFDDLTSGEGWKYNRHFNKLYEDAVKRAGWLPNEEKERMHRNFMGVCNRTKGHAQVIAGTFGCNYKFTDTPDGAVIDIEATEEAKRKDFICGIDADAMAQHWDMLQEIRDKVNALNDFNRKHGIPVMQSPGAYDLGGFTGYVLGTRDIEGNTHDLTQEQHDKYTWQYFKIKK